MSPFEEIAELAPGNTTERDLEVEFKHQLTPIKLAIIVNGKTYPAKLAPEVGALLRPFQMTRTAFMAAQSRISGMHESSRRCALILMCSSHDSYLKYLGNVFWGFTVKTSQVRCSLAHNKIAQLRKEVKLTRPIEK